MSTAGSDPMARAAALESLIREHADAAERERRLAEPVAAALAEAGLFRLAAPPAYQGAAAEPVTQLQVIEKISSFDAAAGWNLMIGIETFGLICLSFRNGSKLFADPSLRVASSTAAVGSAAQTGDQHRINGRWQFVSGVHNCHWFGGMVRRERDGAAVGGGEPVYAFVARDRIEILDTWHVGGLRGSGSHDVRVTDVLVPPEQMAIPDRDWIAELREQVPVLRIPLGVRLSYNKVGVALGIARAAIDAFVELAECKTPRFGSVGLRDRPFAQRAIAEAEVRVRSARALVVELLAQVWDAAVQRRPIEARLRALLQIACSDAARGCVEAVETVAEAAGTTANFRTSPLERAQRDVRVVRQHVTVAPHLIEDAGRVLLGLEPSSMLLALP